MAFLLHKGAASHMYTPLPHLLPSPLNNEPRPLGEGLVYAKGAKETDCMWQVEVDCGDHDKSDEEAFVSNYIPQCFCIDGS